jgi:hypothetical protein
MKTMLLLGATSSFLFAFTPMSFAQTDPTITSASVALTCRSALQGDQFTQVLDVASPPCCYVSIEEDWYKANGIRVSSIYQRSNGDTYRAETCQLMSDVQAPLDELTTGGIGSGGAQGVETAGQTTIGAGATSGNGANGGSNGAGSGGGTQGANSGQGGSGGANSGQNGNGGTGDDGNNGHGNDVGGVDPSNPGNSNGAGQGGNSGSGNGGGKGNNGYGNGGGDGSPNGKQDETR